MSGHHLYDKDDLLDLIAHDPERVVFLVGSAVTAPASKGQPGVPGSEAMLDLIRDLYVGDPAALARLEVAIAAGAGNRYQAAFRHVGGTRGQNAANGVIRRAVLCARVPSAAFPEVPRDIDGDARRVCRSLETDEEGWFLPPAVGGLGRVLAHVSSRSAAGLRPIVLTSNFDPLVAVATRRAGGAAQPFVLSGDGGIHAHDGDGVLVVHFHGDWWRADTLHCEIQLQQARPELAAELAQLLGERTLVVLGYGGWDDVFTQSLVSVVQGNLAHFEVAWAFYENDPEQIAERYERLLRSLSKGIGRGRLHLYKGIDAHAFLPRLADRLGAPSLEDVRSGSGRGAAPPTLVEPAPPAIDNENIVLKCIGELCLRHNALDFSSDEVTAALPPGVLLEGDAADALTVLREEGFVEHFTLSHLRLTDFGLASFLREHYGYEALRDQVISLIIHEPDLSASECAERLGQPTLVVQHALEDLESERLVRLVHTILGTSVDWVSPRLRRRFPAAPAPKEIDQGPVVEEQILKRLGEGKVADGPEFDEIFRPSGLAPRLALPGVTDDAFVAAVEVLGQRGVLKEVDEGGLSESSWQFTREGFELYLQAFVRGYGELRRCIEIRVRALKTVEEVQSPDVAVELGIPEAIVLHVFEDLGEVRNPRGDRPFALSHLGGGRLSIVRVDRD